MRVFSVSTVAASLLCAFGIVNEPERPADEVRDLRAEVEQLKRMDEAHERAILRLARGLDHRAGVVAIQAAGNVELHVDAEKVTLATPDG